MVQKQQAHGLLKQSKITFSVEIIVEQDKLFFHTQAAAPPIFWVKTNPSPFINREIHYKFDIYTKNTAGHFVFYNPHSGQMSITILIFLLLNFFISHPLPIKQPIKIDNNNLSTPKSGVKDLVVTHYDCSSKRITNMLQYYKLTKLANVKSNRQTFKYSSPKYKFFHKFEHFKYAPTSYTINLATKRAFVNQQRL